MTVTIATFRAVLPEFSNSTKVSDALIQFNLDLAVASLSPEVWGDRLDAGVTYYAAHYVALASQRASALASGQGVGAAGAAAGLVTSKSVGGVSVSRDVGVGQIDGGGSFNLTQYGQTYLTLRESVAVGALQF